MYIGLFECFTAFVTLARCDVNLFAKTSSGIVKGTRNVGADRSFKIFYGVPYAEPPIGRLRFKAPVPVKSWRGIRDATELPPACVQPQNYGVIDSLAIGQEDCLYLNIYTPMILTKGGKKLPVIVFIHGGGFALGNGAYYKPDYFMERNVVFVTLNYRLGVIGFLGMNNDVISGNFGMKDQTLALKWIKENIAAFGGDPDNISLMGQSAGAVSVHAHMFSPLSKGLFHKAIIQSGSILSMYSYYENAVQEAITTKFISISGCSNEDPNEVLRCLQRVPAEDLIKAESRSFVWDTDPTFLFKFTIESKVKNQPFLPARPTSANYVTRDIPWIIGMNSGEGLLKAIRYMADGGKLAKIINSDRKRFLPLIVQYLYTAEPELKDNITQKIYEHYFGDEEIGPDTALKFVQMITDSYFVYPLVSSLLTYSGRRYTYYYDHHGPHSSSAAAGLDRNLGVNHGDEISLLFRNEKLEKKWSSQDRHVSGELVKFWTNFATYSDPNQPFGEKVWTPVETNDIEYLHIKSDSMVMEKKILKERYDFWESLPIGRKIAKK